MAEKSKKTSEENEILIDINNNLEEIKGILTDLCETSRHNAQILEVIDVVLELRLTDDEKRLIDVELARRMCKK